MIAIALKCVVSLSIKGAEILGWSNKPQVFQLVVPLVEMAFGTYIVVGVNSFQFNPMAPSFRKWGRLMPWKFSFL